MVLDKALWKYSAFQSYFKTIFVRQPVITLLQLNFPLELLQGDAIFRGKFGSELRAYKDDSEKLYQKIVRHELWLPGIFL